MPWSFSKEHHGPHILLSDNYRVAHGCHFDWEKVIGNVIWRTGVHKFDVQIDLNMLASSNTWQIVVGVSSVASSTTMQTHLGASGREWGMTCLSGQKIHKNRVEDYCNGFARGDIVGVIVDLNAGTIEFCKNGTPLGFAYTDVKGPLTPCISLLKGQKAILVN